MPGLMRSIGIESEYAVAMPVIAFATWLMWRGRVGLAALAALLALLANEDAALWVFGFGAVVLLAARGNRPER